MHLPRYSSLWLPGYVRGRLKRWAGATLPRPARVWPAIAAQHADSAGRPPVYTFFYPQEQYRESLLAPLAEMTAQGIGDVEVHIHHDGEGEMDFVSRMSGFIENLSTRQD